jgi:hypothetical protein
MLQRGWGTLSAEEWGREILPGTVNNKLGLTEEDLAGAGRTPSNQEWESL